MSLNLFNISHDAIIANSIEGKLNAVREISSLWNSKSLTKENSIEVYDIKSPGRPEVIKIVHKTDLPKRNLNHREGIGAFIHALTHIEFEAIHLGLDVIFRFRNMSEDFYSDWINLTEEECTHFELLNGHLKEFGYQYGDFPVHAELWELARLSKNSLLERMAVVPRMAEARGLDVSPSMQNRLRKAGYLKTEKILQKIYEDEIGHVGIGSKWFAALCEEKKQNSFDTYISILHKYGFTELRKPINREARLAAGFTEKELDYFETSLK
ncbi:MAG: ferritin-like domain-containing protein [Spirochaetia bacterium]|nr:ferritin-like domain-containing protein [Spirochaetia bacterium]